MTDAVTPAGIDTRTRFDRLGRATMTIQNALVAAGPTGLANDADVASTFGYDAAGELTAYCPAAQVVWLLGAPDTTNGCDPAAVNTTLTPYRSGWHWTYDDAGHKASEIAPVNAAVGMTQLDTTTWTYDGGGRLVSQASVTPTGGTVDRHTDTSYDGVGRVTRSTTYAGSGTGTEKLRSAATWYADGHQATATSSVNGAVTDTLAFSYDTAGRPDQVKRGTTVLTDTTWNPDGTLQARADGTAGTSAFTYDWAKRLSTATLPAGWQTGSGLETFAYRADGLIAGRGWNTTPATPQAAFTYDATKRPTGLSVALGANSATFTQTYDRLGNVTAEGRTFPAAVTGDAGSGLQSFVYDALSRLTGSTGSAGLDAPNQTYRYDLDGNRTSKSLGTDTWAAAYDRTDELVAISRNGGIAVSATSDPYGNLLADPETGTSGGLVTYGFDTADRTTSITNGTTPTTIGLDALGRARTRTTGGVTDTYGYLGLTDAVVQVTTGTVTTNSLLDPAGDRLGTRTGASGAVAWFLPDLHGSVAGSLDQGATAVIDALRYDGYGMTSAHWTAGGVSPNNAWKYQGRLDVSPTTTPLYDFAARDYAPGLGTFTGLDTVTGSAQSPARLNRFLYAAANPATLVDPDGHCAYSQGDDMFGYLGESFGCAAGTVAGTAKATIDMGVSTLSFVVCGMSTPCAMDTGQTLAQAGQSAVDTITHRGIAVVGDTVANAAKAGDQWVKDASRPGFDGAYTFAYTGATIALAVAGTKGLGFARGGRLAIEAADAAATAGEAAAGSATASTSTAIAGFDSIPLRPTFSLKSLIRIGPSYVPESISGVPGGVVRPAIKFGTAPGYKGNGWRFPFHGHIYLDDWKNFFKPWDWLDKPVEPTLPSAPKIGPKAQ